MSDPRARARDAALAVLLNLGVVLDAVVTALRALWNLGALAGAKRAADALGVPVPDHTHVVERLAELPIADGVAHALLFEVADRIASSVTTPSDAGTTERAVSSAIQRRAKLLAQTEQAKAAHLAAMEVYRANHVQRLHWVGGQCKRCQANAAASPIGMNDHWPDGSPPVHPGCHCWTIPA